MKPTAFRAILVLTLLALAAGAKSKRKSSRKSTTTEAPPLPPVIVPPASPVGGSSQGANPWFDRRAGGPFSAPGPSRPGSFPGPVGPSGAGPHRNGGRFGGPGGDAGPSASGGRPAYQGRNNYQGAGSAQGAGSPQGPSGPQGSGSYQGPNGGPASGGSQGANNAQGAGNSQGPSSSRGMRNQGRGRPGPPSYFLSWRHAPQQTRLLYTWEEADQLCRHEGAQLISVNNREKQGYLAWVLDEDEIRSVWTAGKFRAGAFQWADNTPVSAGFTRWSNSGRFFQQQPDNAEGFEDCIAFYNEGSAWHDEQCTQRRHFVCEY